MAVLTGSVHVGHDNIASSRHGIRRNGVMMQVLAQQDAQAAAGDLCHLPAAPSPPGTVLLEALGLSQKEWPHDYQDIGLKIFPDVDAALKRPWYLPFCTHVTSVFNIFFI